MRGLRSHRKSWADAAAGEMRRQLTYKARLVRLRPAEWTAGARVQQNRTLDSPECGTLHDRDENAGINLARLPASQAEALSDGKTGPARHVAVKRVNHLRKVA